MGSALGGNFFGSHGSVLAEVDSVLPGEELHAVLDKRLTTEMAVSGGLVVLGFAKGKVAGKACGMATLCLHGGYGPDETTSRGVPIYRTSPFVFKSTQHAANLFALAELGNIYSRLGNPTVSVLEQRMAMIRNTTPHFVRCVKPNASLQPNDLDGGYVMRQLREMGMVHVVRARRRRWLMRRGCPRLSYAEPSMISQALREYWNVLRRCRGSSSQGYATTQRRSRWTRWSPRVCSASRTPPSLARPVG